MANTGIQRRARGMRVGTFTQDAEARRLGGRRAGCSSVGAILLQDLLGSEEIVRLDSLGKGERGGVEQKVEHDMTVGRGFVGKQVGQTFEAALDEGGEADDGAGGGRQGGGGELGGGMGVDEQAPQGAHELPIAGG